VHVPSNCIWPKADDQVEWSYLRVIMLKLGFSHQLVESVELVSLSVRVDGQFSTFSSQQGEFATEIPCLLIFFSYVVKG
jgi:hypothetical protein